MGLINHSLIAYLQVKFNRLQGKLNLSVNNCQLDRRVPRTLLTEEILMIFIDIYRSGSEKELLYRGWNIRRFTFASWHTISNSEQIERLNCVFISGRD